MENLNKYIQIDNQRKQKDYPTENNGNFQNILKLLTEQRSKIDEMLVKTRNYQVTRQKIIRAGANDSEDIDDINFLEDISGYQNGVSQNAEELRKKLDTLKKRHKSEMSGNSLDNSIYQNQIAKKKNTNNGTYQQQYRNINQLSPQKEKYGVYQDNQYQYAANYSKNQDPNYLQYNQSQQRTLSLHNYQQNMPIEQELYDNIDQQKQLRAQMELRNQSNPNIVLYSENYQITNPSDHHYLPPISKSVNQSVDLSRRQQRSSSISYKKHNNSFNRDYLNKSDLGMFNTEQEEMYNYIMPTDIIYVQTNTNTRGQRMNTHQKNAYSGYKMDSYIQRQKQQAKSNQIKKIYLKNPLTQKVQYFNHNTNISPEKRDFRDTFMNEFNRKLMQNSIENSKLQKKQQKKYTNQKSQRAAILDKDIFNMHKKNQLMPSLDADPTEFSYYNNSQIIANTDYDSNIIGRIPQGLNNINYYSDFEQLIKRQSKETLNILEHVFENSKNKSKDELLDNLQQFKQNFTIHAEKQDRQLREIKKRYHHFKKFDLPRDYNLEDQTY